MTPVEINLSLSEGARIVYNGLYASTDPQCLLHDLALVALPDGTRIDVSWSPEMDPQGRYYVTVYRDTWSNSLAEVSAASAYEAARHVEDLARHYSEAARV